MDLLNIVASYYETGLTHSVALDQMPLLSLMLAGRGAKDLTEFACQEDQLHPPWLEAVGSTSPRDFVSVAVAAGEASAHPFANHGQGSRVVAVGRRRGPLSGRGRRLPTS